MFTLLYSLIFIITDKVRTRRGSKVEGVVVMKDEERKLVKIESSHTQWVDRGKSPGERERRGCRC